MPSIGSTIHWKSLCLVSRDAFLAVDRVIGKASEQPLGDEFLRAHVEVELDVVRRECIDLERRSEVRAEQFAGGARGADGGFEISDSWALAGERPGILHKKNGRRNEFSSRLFES